jgi:DNA-binding protein HU-beta
VNKTELIETLAVRLGDRKAASTGLDAVITEIQTAVTKGDKVTITGFGVFEKRVRAARTARNPRTGESVKVKKTAVPAFRPGATFKELVAAGKAPKAAVATKRTSAASAAPVKTVSKAPLAKATPAKTVAARKTVAPTKTVAPKKTVAPTKTMAAAKPATKATRTAAAPKGRATRAGK